MHDEYLWAGTGRPDPEIERLEDALRPYRYRPQPLKLAATRTANRWLGIAILCASCFAISVFAWAHTRSSADHNSPTVEAHFRSYDAGHVDGSE